MVRTRRVMAMAKTPSLNASTRPLLIDEPSLSSHGDCGPLPCGRGDHAVLRRDVLRIAPAHVRSCDRLAACGTAELGHDVLAAAAMGEDHRWSGLTLGRPAVSPAEQPDHDRIEVTPALGEPVLEPLGTFLVAPPLEDAVVDQRL